MAERIGSSHGKGITYAQTKKEEEIDLSPEINFTSMFAAIVVVLF